MDLSIVGKETWALSRPCPPGMPGCGSTVFTTPTSGGPWHALNGAPKLQYPYLQLVRTSPNDAFLAAQATDGTLYTTTDGGRSWASYPLPSLCNELQHLTALSEHKLWVVCAGPAPGHSQPKELFHSVNDGKTWVLVATSSPTRHRVREFCRTSGIVTLVTSVSPDRLLIAFNQGNPIASTDGGKTWEPQGLPSLRWGEAALFHGFPTRLGPSVSERHSLQNNRRWGPLDSGFEVTAGISVTPGTPSRFETHADAHQRREQSLPVARGVAAIRAQSRDPFSADRAWHGHRADCRQRAAGAHLELVHDSVGARLDVQDRWSRDADASTVPALVGVSPASARAPEKGCSWKRLRSALPRWSRRGPLRPCHPAGRGLAVEDGVNRHGCAVGLKRVGGQELEAVFATAR